jgi:cytochrome P450
LLGNALLALLTRPGLARTLRERPGLVPAWVDETLRYDAPVQLLLRRTTRAAEIAGSTLPEGAVVAAWLGSANRDERRYEQPDDFVLTRRVDHLGFGAGPHYCIGARLARMEAIAALSALLESTQTLELVEAPGALPRLETPHLRAPTRLLVELG